ncbi:MAG: NADH:flavin oxidoreductase [Bacteroidales bacterium]|nr:MAG: NADH:flavin oxidoreductase [Bacteroidales bacterium]
MDIFSPINIKGKEIKNRIVFPPLVNFAWSETDGIAIPRHVAHYEERAKGGAGLIIVEATCINQQGRIFNYQLGAWSDDQIDGLSKITATCHKHGAVVLLQIHHAGLTTRKGVSEFAYGPSVDPENERSVELTIDQIHQIRDEFIAAAIRAEKAGFDGVELHGAHGYLLTQFASSAINRRTDEYGGTTENRLRLACEIIDGIKASTGKDFIIDYRLAACSPTLTDGIEIAQLLEKKGVDIIHASHGGEKGINAEVPAEFEFNSIVYMGTVIKKHVKVPVIVVNQIQTPERANKIISSGLADFVAIGRDMLTDAHWANKAKKGENIIYCIDCQPKCKRYVKATSCPLFSE